MAQMETFLKGFSMAIHHPEPGDSTYLDLIARQPVEPPPPGYPLKTWQVPVATAETIQLRDFSDNMEGPGLREGAPKPEPKMVIRPDY